MRFVQAEVEIRNHEETVDIGVAARADEIDDAYRRDLDRRDRELVVQRRVDSFLIFVKEALLTFAQWQPPALLAEGWTVEVRRVFEAADLQSLKDQLIQDLVERLARNGWGETMIYLQRRLQIKVRLPGIDRHLIDAAIASRNAIVHNHGRIDSQYQKMPWHIHPKSGSASHSRM